MVYNAKCRFCGPGEITLAQSDVSFRLGKDDVVSRLGKPSLGRVAKMLVVVEVRR